jgi:hypothetical protein
MSGNGELVRYTRLRAPEEKCRDDTTTYDKLKQAVTDLIDGAAKEHVKITIVALVQDDLEEPIKELIKEIKEDRKKEQP